MAGPILAANFMLGRRYVIALGLAMIVGLIVYRQVRIRWYQWAGAIMAAFMVMAVLTVPFNNIRNLSDTGQDFTLKEAGAVAFAGKKVAGANFMDAGDVFALTAARADILRELSQVVSKMPVSGLQWGRGIVSQVAIVVPGQFWPEKKIYINNQMYSEARLLYDAGLPATDIAGSLVLYSYGEFGWLAFAYFAAVLVGFVGAATLLTRLFGTDSGFHLWTLSLLLSYVVLADNAAPYRMFGDLRFLVILGVLHVLIGVVLPKGAGLVPQRRFTDPARQS